jgi:hypothetical protein
MKEIGLKGDVKIKYQIILLNLLAFITSLIKIYKSNSIYFVENVFTVTLLIYVCIMLFSFFKIKSNNILFLTSVILYLDIPLSIKGIIQNKITELGLTSSLFLIHIVTLIFLVFVLFLIFLLINKNYTKYLVYFLLIFYSLSFINIITEKKQILNTSLVIHNKVEHISKNYYFLLFDEYPSEMILEKYKLVGRTDLPSNFLPHLGYQNDQNIFSNYTSTELSTTSMLTGTNNIYNINQAILALKNNVFTNQKDYYFNHISIFDEENRPNSLVSVEFFEGSNNLLLRYIIPYFLHFILPNAGVFTNYEIYHNKAILRLNQITKSKVKNVTYIHFFTPHVYPLVERLGIGDRIKIANSWMKKSINIIEKNDSKAGIIILSDHGLRLNKIPKKDWTKNILYFKNVSLDTASLNKKGLTGLVSSIRF